MVLVFWGLVGGGGWEEGGGVGLPPGHSYLLPPPPGGGQPTVTTVHTLVQVSGQHIGWPLGEEAPALVSFGLI